MNRPVILLRLPDLRKRGIKWSRQHIDRQIKMKRFPKPVKIGQNTDVWIDSEIDDWIAGLMAEREQESPAKLP